jgi:hypothetical protein
MGAAPGLSSLIKNITINRINFSIGYLEERLRLNIRIFIAASWCMLYIYVAVSLSSCSAFPS